MKSDSSNTRNHFQTSCQIAISTLGLSQEDLQNRFSNYTLSLIRTIKDKEEDISVRIHLEDCHATLLCQLEESDKCNMSFIYIDKLSEDRAEEYILYLSENHDYDFLRSAWILSNCYLSIIYGEDIIYFKFFR